MRSFLSLLVVSLKNTYNLTDGKTKNSWIKRLTPVFILLALTPSLVSFTFLTRDALNMLIPIQQEGVIIGLLFAVIAMVIFFFGIFLIPSVFYFSKDVETLLSYPLKPEAIVLSKFAVALIFEYLTVFFIGAPILAGYISVVQPGLGFYLVLIPTLILLPVVPLILSSLIVMLVMMWVPFAKNRDFFNYLSGFLVLAFAIGFNMTISNMAVTLDQAELIRLLQSGNNSLMNFYQVSIPTVPFAVTSVVSSSVVDFGIYALMSLGFLLLFTLTAKFLYFKGAIGISETGANRKTLSDKAYAKSTILGNPILTYALKELKLMIRTPIYFLNNIATALIMPLILGGTLFTGIGADPDIEALLSMIPWKSPVLNVYMMAAGLAAGFFMSGLNLITPTAISREGQNVWFMKIIPMSYFDQAQAKVLSGLLISILGSWILVLPFAVFFKLSIVHISLIIVGSVLASISMNYWGMLVDIFHPKLVWEQEAVAVKQNINALFTMLPAFGFSAGLFFLVAKLPQENWVMFLLIGFAIVLDALSIWALKQFASKGMAAIEP